MWWTGLCLTMLNTRRPPPYNVLKIRFLNQSYTGALRSVPDASWRH